MTIRQALIKDAFSIKELIQELSYEITAKDVEKNIDVYNNVNGHILIMENNANVVGFISGAYIPLFHASGSMFRITALCVSEKCKTQGIGKSLVRAIEMLCKESGCFYIEVTSGAQRENEAHLFYQKLGYTIYDGKRFRKIIET